MNVSMEVWVAVGVGVVLGFFVAWLLGRSNKRAAVGELTGRLEGERTRGEDVTGRLVEVEKLLRASGEAEGRLRSERAVLEARLEEEKRAVVEKEALLEKAEGKLGDVFKALSADALRASQEQFLELAKSTFKAQQESAKGEMDERVAAVERMVKPIGDSLEKAQVQVGELEKAREVAYASIQEQMAHMKDAHLGLQKETGQLVKALRQPTGRGQWGEMQLRRVVEMSGMQEHCDFATQTTVTDDEGKRLRPDLVVYLPGGQQVVVDSKAPMDAYLDALEVDNDVAKEAALARHAEQVRRHISQLGSKRYADQFETSPEFVVLFLPSEAFFSAALMQDGGLIEKGVEQGVILATPTTLIALLRAVSYGWRQEVLAANAQEIAVVGRELYGRLSKFTGFLDKLGKSLGTTVGHFNSAVGSLDSRVMVSARKFEALGAGPETARLGEVSPVEKVVRDVNVVEEEKMLEPSMGFADIEDGGGFADVGGLEDGFEGFLAEGEGEGI